MVSGLAATLATMAAKDTDRMRNAEKKRVHTHTQIERERERESSDTETTGLGGGRWLTNPKIKPIIKQTRTASA